MPKYFPLLLYSICFLLGSYTHSLAQPAYRLLHFYTEDDGLSSNHITSLTKYKIGLVIIGTPNGVNIYDGYNFQITSSDKDNQFSLNSDKINSIGIDKDISIWIGSDNGINNIIPFKGINKLYFNKKNLEYPPLKTDTISNSLLTSTPDGTIWIVNNGIICQIINGEVKQYYPEKFDRVTKIISDNNNNIFAFNNQSLICLDPSGQLLFEIQKFTSPLFGLQQMSKMSNLFKTKNGEIIIEDYLNEQFFKINPLGEIEDITNENHWLPFFFKELDRQAKAYNINTLRKFDFLETEEGLIWVATNFGLVKMKIEQSNVPIAKDGLTHFVIRYKKYNSSTGKLQSLLLNPNNVKPIRLNSKEKYLELQFINSDYTSPLRNTFSHYLEGFEEDYLPYNNNNSVSYSNLPAGNYTFKLKSKNAQGVESDFIFEFPIIVEQPFLESYWFSGIVVVSVLLALLLFIRAKVSQERRINRLRSRMASDLHDEVSNSLNNIRIITKETNFSNAEKMKADFLRIQKMSSQAIQHVEDVIWSIDTSYSKAENLFFKMEDYIDDILKSKNIPVQFTREGLNDNAYLGFVFRRNMLLIFKEAISNIIKHTKPLQVDIIYKKTKDGYFMSIRNTFEERIDAKNSTGKGLVGMKQRAEAIGATLKIIEEENRFEILMEKKF